MCLKLLNMLWYPVSSSCVFSLGLYLASTILVGELVLYQEKCGMLVLRMQLANKVVSFWGGGAGRNTENI
jgi:hypothetical protein